MEQNFSRFAIYWRPEPGPLADFGAAWLGWDPARGVLVDHPSLMPDEDDITATPRKYGLHGTIKPPMRLAEGQDFAGLKRAFDAFCAAHPPVLLPQGLGLARLGGFLALKPLGDAAPLARLAAAVVRELDNFRAPPSEAELKRRRAAGLNPAQEANLMAWGYPYVMEEFRFHVTLSGRLDPARAEAAQAALAPRLAALAPIPFRMDALTLLGEDENGRFHDLHRASLAG